MSTFAARELLMLLVSVGVGVPPVETAQPGQDSARVRRRVSSPRGARRAERGPGNERRLRRESKNLMPTHPGAAIPLRLRIELIEAGFEPEQRPDAKLMDRWEDLSLTGLLGALGRRGHARLHYRVDQPVAAEQPFKLSVGGEVPVVHRQDAGVRVAFEEVGCTINAVVRWPEETGDQPGRQWQMDLRIDVSSVVFDTRAEGTSEDRGPPAFARYKLAKNFPLTLGRTELITTFTGTAPDAHSKSQVGLLFCRVRVDRADQIPLHKLKGPVGRAATPQFAP